MQQAEALQPLGQPIPPFLPLHSMLRLGASPALVPEVPPAPRPAQGPGSSCDPARGREAQIHVSVLFEVHQIKGSKITDVDEVGIDTGGICVSERGLRELPGARGDLSMLKPGQASKEKNGQVMGAGLEDD